MSLRRVVCLTVLVLGAQGCDDPAATLDAVIEEARACDPGDTCVVAGSTDCSCGQPVNEASVDEVEAAAGRVSCCDAFGRCVAVDCAAFGNVRCEAGRCVGD